MISSVFDKYFLNIFKVLSCIKILFYIRMILLSYYFVIDVFMSTYIFPRAYFAYIVLKKMSSMFIV